MNGVITQVHHYLPLKRQLQLLALPAARRRQLLTRVARQVVRDSRKRIRTQTDLQGRPYARRAVDRDGRRSRRKMLTGLGRRLKTIRTSGTEVVIGWRNRLTSRIAAQQQHGTVETLTPADLPNASASARSQPATRQQARALLEAGFRVKNKSGKGKKRPTQRWIMQNMTLGGAGMALRRLREWGGQPANTRWTVKLPARSFLGATDREVSHHIDTLTQQFLQELKHGIR